MKLVTKLNYCWGVFEVGGDLILHPLAKPLCPMIWGGEVCYGELLLHDFRCYYHPSIKHYHCVVHLKCSKCGWHYIFGLAIPPALFDRLTKSKYHGKTLRMELKEIYPDLPKEVEERLRRWAYW